MLNFVPIFHLLLSCSSSNAVLLKNFTVIDTFLRALAQPRSPQTAIFAGFPNEGVFNASYNCSTARCNCDNDDSIACVAPLACSMSGDVVSIALASYNLGGTISTFIGLLTQLWILCLNSNELTGTGRQVISLC
jgi:hypothetical protein